MPALKVKLKRAALSAQILEERAVNQHAVRVESGETRATALIDAAAAPVAKLCGRAPKGAKGKDTAPDRLATLQDDGRFVIVSRADLVAALMPRK